MPHRWCKHALLRKEQIESGKDLTFNEVFRPLYIKRISELAPSNILEVGAGTGHLSRDLAKLGFNITAIEPSLGMFKVAESVVKGEGINLINCTSCDLLPTSIFDLSFSHLVAHVVDDIDNFFISIASHLIQGGNFLFSLPHPCFYNDYKNFFGPEYNYMKSLVKEVSFFITNDTKNPIERVPYHHRPLQDYINSLVFSGFSITRFEEVYPPKEIQNKYGHPWKTPRYCMFVCKKL